MILPAQELEQGTLHCGACAAEYPIIDGVPILLRDVDAYLAAHRDSFLLRQDLPGPIMSRLWSAVPEDSALGTLRSYLNAYAVSHFPEVASQAGIEASPFGGFAWWDVIREECRTAKREIASDSPAALVVGGALGREVRELLDLEFRALYLDSSFLAAKLARQLARGRAFRGQVMLRNERWVELPLPGYDGARADFAVGDIQDPPYRAQSFDLIVWLNGVDAVFSPLTALQQSLALLRPGGQLLIASPFHWSSLCTEAKERLGDGRRAVGGERPALEVLEAFFSGQIVASVEAEVRSRRRKLPWILRQHEQSYDCFLSDLLRVRV